MRTLITASCQDQKLMLTSKPVIASGGINEDSILFTFDEAWDGYTKTAVFYRSKEAVYHCELVDDMCIIPSEVIALKGEMFFGVFGVKGNMTKTSQVISYHIEQGAASKGIAPSDPTPSVYSQILATAEEALAVANAVKSEADSGKFNGKNGNDGIPCTHYWDGTKLVVTSASGTSSAELKGDRGDTGAPGATGSAGATGATGATGEAGYSPVRGIDYWTAADIASIKAYVDDAILGGAW